VQFVSLLQGTATIECEGDALIAGVTDVVQQVQPGYVFVAIKGNRVDGHDLIDEALSRGAVAIVFSRQIPWLQDIAWAQVTDTRRALAHLVASFYGSPAAKLRMVGVTGTNGKTTTAFLIQAILRAAGFKVGLLSTVIIDDGEVVEPATLTTPDAPLLYSSLARMVENGAGHVVMEVSSHSLVLGRVEAIEYDTAVFLNLTQDHLDLHGTMEAYFGAKAGLFTRLGQTARKQPKAAIINIDDEYGQRLVHMCSSKVLTYAIDRAADFCARDVRGDSSGAVFCLVAPSGECEVTISTPGKHSIYNALAAAGAAWAEGASLAAIAKGLARPTVPGRMERIEQGQAFDVFVDYAHTPDGLENVLRAARNFTRGRLIVVFGCGGDRDRGKRPLMGEIAGRLADIVILTADNPRTEEPSSILQEILSGITETHLRQKVLVEVSRRQAIRQAIFMASKGDVILIAGKGHENYQIFRDETIHFDDREEASLALGEYPCQS